jgi:hypothetical protein
MKKVITISAIVVLMACAIGAGLFFLQHQKTASMRAPLLASLKDADSAQFRNEHFVKDDSYLCGEVNSKNSMGGYVGYKRFISFPKGFALEGYPLDSFYVDEAGKIKAMSNWLDIEIAIMKSQKRKPSDDEVNGIAFDNLWKEYSC